MNEMLRNSIALREMADESIANREAIENKIAHENDEMRGALALLGVDRNKKRAKLNEFSTNLKNSLLKEALGFIYYNSVNEMTLAKYKPLMESFLNSYILENGANNILSKMRTTSIMLSEMAYVVESSFRSIMEDVDPENDESFDVETTDKTEFFDNLKKINDVEDVENAIRMRVANAEEEFATDNMQDKFDLKNIMTQTAERIEALRKDEYTDDDKEYNDNLEHESAIRVQRKTSMINARPKTILEQMVLTVSTNSMKEKTTFIESVSGRLDIESLIESVECMYTFLETLNTIKLEKVDEVYLENFLDNL